MRLVCQGTTVRAVVEKRGLAGKVDERCNDTAEGCLGSTDGGRIRTGTVCGRVEDDVFVAKFPETEQGAQRSSRRRLVSLI